MELLPFSSKEEALGCARCQATVMYLEPAHIVVYVQASATSGSCIMGT